MANKPDSIPYELGGPDCQKWLGKYRFAPRGIAFLEPGIVPLDAPEMAAYNIAKSAYQLKSDVFNLDWLAKETKIPKAELDSRIQRMYHDHLIMLVMNPATQVYGWGLYYWLVKLKEGTPPEVKKEFTDWYQDKDPICTGFETTGGDFDYYNGDHMRVLDNLLADVIEPWKNRPEVDFVHLCPVRRDVRESSMNMWDSPGEMYREFFWSKEHMDKLAKVQDKLDATDIKILAAINKKRPVEDYFNFKALADISGFDEKDMLAGIKSIIEQKRILVPLVFTNWQKLGLTYRMFVVRLFQITPCHRKAEIVDQLAQEKDFDSVWEYTDSFYDIGLWACNQTTDVEALRAKIQEYGEVEEIKETDVTRQFRRWVCRLDDQHNFWEECVFTDDFLLNFTGNREVQK
ncbi:hypothetical protein [Dethiosulfatarculus sandiegensis]|uniref:AsnC family transcriptional regulator n=1 Tax=Dethiosulfatarculus sandiegensis TaxID=1429043 RepID=A0A0D2HZ67_9BACT|nr:hypothetical protein [Dethiosulfatarculus sandiegensis]KIX15528.1 AsnC family transcriptional regulator [Dethiosulfatarculus sandiegensis]